MAFFDFFKRNKESRSLPTEQITVTTSTSDADALGLIFGRGNADLLNQHLSVVYRCVDLISSSIASLPLYIYKNSPSGEKKMFKSHPLFNLLLNKPNPFMTAHDFIQKGMQDLLLEGNWYAIIHRDNDFKISSLEYISAKKVTIDKRYDKEGALSKVFYNIIGRKRLYEDFEILHIKSNNLDEDGVAGISIIQFATESIRLASWAEQAVKNSYSSGGRLSGIISVEHTLTSKARQEMKEAWNTAFGRSNSGGVAVLSGAQKYLTVSQNNSDMELLDSRRFNIEEICRFFGISPILAYDLSHQTYASADAAHLALLTDCLSNYLFKIEAELETKCLTPKELEKCEVKFDTKEFLRADSKTQLELHRGYYNMGVLSPNDIREELDLDNLGEKGDVYLVQGQYVELSNAKNLGSALDKNLDNTIKPKEDENTETEKTDEENDSASVDELKNNDGTTDE